MCTWGDEVILRVNIPAELSHTGEAHWDMKAVDRCIAPIVEALNNAGILTASSCCGHGKTDGSIMLQDGRTLFIGQMENEALREVLDVARRILACQLGGPEMHSRLVAFSSALHRYERQFKPEGD